MPGHRPLASGSAAPYASGAVVGEFLSRCHPGGGKAAFFTRWLSTHEHAEKLRGFESSLDSFGGSLRLGPLIEGHDDEREGYQQALGVLRAHPDLTSIDVSDG